MYKAYLAGLSGQQLQFVGLSDDEATAFAIGVHDKAREAYPKSRRQIEDAVEQLADGEWVTARDAMLERLNRMQAERDELHSRCDKLAAEVRQQVEDFGKLRVERDHLPAELVATRRESAGEGDCCNGEGFCPLCDKGRA
jgi:chromosome segregation ATPase